MKNIGIDLIIALLSLGAGIVFYSFTTFATKDEVKESVVYRLDRIETKLDRLIESKK